MNFKLPSLGKPLVTMGRFPQRLGWRTSRVVLSRSLTKWPPRRSGVVVRRYPGVQTILYHDCDFQSPVLYAEVLLYSFLTLPSLCLPLRHSRVSCLRSSGCFWRGRKGEIRNLRRSALNDGLFTPFRSPSPTTESTPTSCSTTTSRKRSRWACCRWTPRDTQCRTELSVVHLCSYANGVKGYEAAQGKKIPVQSYFRKKWLYFRLVIQMCTIIFGSICHLL